MPLLRCARCVFGTREEFEEALQYAGLFITSQELSAFFKLFDKSGDGFVDFDEFLVPFAYVRRRAPRSTRV